eukprot:9493079-Pyramimonas_sp.AAC.1
MGLSIAFPVDYRYGWDLKTPQHQKLLDSCAQQLGIQTHFWSPRCSPWSAQSNRATPEKRDRTRTAEVPTLTWLDSRIDSDFDRGEASILENPRSSAIYAKSPLRNQSTKSQRQHTDQCQFGAVDETGLPIQKPTALLSKGIQLEHSIKRCRDEHKCAQHGILQGRVGALHRTALAAVYPWAFCLALLLDISIHVHHSA